MAIAIREQYLINSKVIFHSKHLYFASIVNQVHLHLEICLRDCQLQNLT